MIKAHSQTKGPAGSASHATRLASAFLWSLWKIHQIELPVLVCLIVGIRISMSLEIGLRGVWNGLLHLGLGFVWLTFIARLANGDSEASVTNSNTKGSAYPNYMLTLPVSDRWMVYAPMVFAAVCMSGLTGLYTVLMSKWTNGIIMAGLDLFLTSITISLQAISWSKIGGSFSKILLSGALIFGPIPLAAFLGYFQRSMFLIPEIYCGIALTAIVLVQAGFARSRHGYSLRSRVELSLPQSSRTARAKEIPHFKSGLETLIWILWRRQGIILPIATTAVCVLYGLFPLMAPSGHTVIIEDGLQIISAYSAIKPGIILCVLLGTALITGAIPRKEDLFHPSLHLHVFTTVKPLSSLELAFALVVNSLKSSALTTLVLSGTLATLVFAVHIPLSGFGFGQAPELFQGSSGAILPAFASLVTLFLLVWNLQTFMLAADLSGRRMISLLPVVLLSGFLVLAIIGNASNVPATSFWLCRAMPWVIVGANIVIACFAGTVLIRRRFISLFQIGVASTVWFVCAMLLSAVLAQIKLFAGGSIAAMPWVMILIPFTRFLIAPLLLDWNRHR